MATSMRYRAPSLAPSSVTPHPTTGSAAPTGLAHAEHGGRRMDEDRFHSLPRPQALSEGRFRSRTELKAEEHDTAMLAQATSAPQSVLKLLG